MTDRKNVEVWRKKLSRGATSLHQNLILTVYILSSWSQKGGRRRSSTLHNKHHLLETWKIHPKEIPCLQIPLLVWGSPILSSKYDTTGSLYIAFVLKGVLFASWEITKYHLSLRLSNQNTIWDTRSCFLRGPKTNNTTIADEIMREPNFFYPFNKDQSKSVQRSLFSFFCIISKRNRKNSYQLVSVFIFLPLIMPANTGFCGRHFCINKSARLQHWLSYFSLCIQLK